MRILSLSLIATVALQPLTAQQPAQQPDARSARVDSVFAAFDHTNTPGCALGVYQDGRLAYSRGYGMANLEFNIAITPRTVFEIGSISKQFTAMSILLLQQDGKLSIDDPVRKYIPELPAYADKITLRHLLSHTSGIRDHFDLQEIEGVNFDGVQDTVDYLRLITKQQEPNFTPGSKYLYSNSGFVLLAQVVYRVSGKPLAKFAAERIFAPLGMHDTWFQDDHTQIIPNRATAYMPRADAPSQYAIRMSMFDQMAGAAGIHTTVEDFGKWLRNYDDATVGGRAALDAMTTAAHLSGYAHDSLAMTGPETAYGFGLDVGTFRGLKVITHTGSWGGYRSAFMRFPEQRFAVATFCNYTNSGPGALAKRVASIYLAPQMLADADSAFRVGLAGSAHADVSAAALNRFAGLWRNVERGEVRRTEVAGDTLVFTATTPEGRHTPLVPLGGNRFRQGPNTEIAFDDTTRMIVRSAAGLPVVYTRVTPVALSPAQLAEYAGSYYTPEVDVRWRIHADSGKLVVTRAGRRVGILLPTYRDGFVMESSVVDFTRDGKDGHGRLSGFLIEAGRVRHLRFVREAETRR